MDVFVEKRVSALMPEAGPFFYQCPGLKAKGAIFFRFFRLFAAISLCGLCALLRLFPSYRSAFGFQPQA
jgi:hypothetical protein